MQTSSLRRQMKNMVNNYSEAEIKVREATSNDPWGPPSSLMSEISDLTFNVVAFTEVMGMIWKRLNDHGKNWRHVYKALTLLDYLIKTGSERVAQQCRENIFTIQTLRDFQFTDRDGRDQGVNVREKAKQLVTLMRDDDKLKQERTQALKTKERMAGAAAGMGSGSLPPPYPGRRTSQPSMAALYGDEFGRSRGSPSSFNSSSSSPHVASDLEQARPQTSGEEELQLQLALAMSREETEKPPPPPVDIDEQTQLQIAMSLSKEEAQKPAPRPPVALEMDEDAQLQIALSLSKEEHQQEQRSRQGDESLLQKALEESKREMQPTEGGSAMKDLVDVFAVASEASPRHPNWDLSGGAARLASSDPWDTLVDARSSAPGIEIPWMAPPASSSPVPPWERARSPPDPWEAPHGAPSPKPNLGSASSTQPWASPANTGASAGDPFTGMAAKVPSRPGSPSDGDLFDEAMDGGQVNMNGRGGGSPEIFDLSRLGESLAAPSPRSCRTPEAFLDPSAASLVNLDILIPANPPAKTKNPFLSGLSAPSATNPFQSEQPRLTLNQMRPSSTSPVPPASSLPYSASLPLPASHQPSSLPSSLTHPTQPGQDMPGNLPQPLLPLFQATTLNQQADQHSQNPFL
ncbi:epsin-3 isoform X2 [Hypomesus transpacificus]|uniref:epsin-3 isoform X2 n=1 Tax=Hypomesus transpacificus TaxID=137520 RepID=UPI001F0857F4|nr:epsin-3 isoform X2 [Hypomesus transpacificus]